MASSGMALTEEFELCGVCGKVSGGFCLLILVKSNGHVIIAFLVKYVDC